MNGENQQYPAPGQADGQWHYRPEAEQPSPTPYAQTPAFTQEDISWTASEFVAHHKGAGWYMLFACVAITAISVIYMITRDMVSAGMVTFITVLFAIAANRKPRTLTYRLDSYGITIGPKRYSYNEFKSFSISQEGAIGSLTFLPLKRFMPPISIYYGQEDHERIMSVIVMHLPYEQRKGDWVDSAMKRIRF